MRAQSLSLTFVVLLCGCASMTQDKFGKRLSPTDVQKFVKCEIDDALRQAAMQRPELKKWGGDYQIFLITERSKSTGVSALDWVIPSSSAKYSLGLGLTGSTEKNETTLIISSTDYSETASPYCSGSPRGSASFRGSLGLAEWAKSVTEIEELLPESASKTLELVVSYDGSITPAYGLTNLGLKLGASASQKITHRLAVVLKERKATPPTKVEIVGGGGKKFLKVLPVVPPQNSNLEFLLLRPESQ